MNTHDYNMLDDLVSSFLDGDDDWHCIDRGTRESLKRIQSFLDDAYPDFQPCECGCVDVKCYECGAERPKLEERHDAQDDE